MRKLLLGTSALIGATALVASATAAAPELTVSGKLNFQWTGGEAPAFNNDTGTASGEDLGNAGSGWQFDQIGSQSEINFFAEGESDGGTTYGANIDYRFLGSGTGSRTDEAYIFISGDWGTIHLGQDDGAVNQTRFYAGSIAPGGYLIDGTTTYAGYSYADTSDRQKILYVSNDLSGFKFALSVMDAARDGVFGAHEDVYEIGASYSAGIGDGSIGISLGYFSADAADDGNNGAEAGVANNTLAGSGDREDIGEYVVGIKAGFGPISFAASYADADESGQLKFDAANGGEAPSQYTLGLAYDLGGGMAVGISYSEEERTDLTHVAASTLATTSRIIETTNELVTIDFGFPIMTGMNGYAGIAFSETDSDSTAWVDANTGFSGAVERSSTDATTYVIGTKVSF